MSSVEVCAGYSNCSCSDAFQLVNQDGTHVYLDVRTADEFKAGHPPGAINIPVFYAGPGGMTPNPDFLAQVEEKFPVKEVALAVGCASGKRSLAAVEKLAAAGFTEVVNVEGGYGAWSASGLPVEK